MRRTEFLMIQQPIEQLTSSATGGENLHQARVTSEAAPELAKLAAKLLNKKYKHIIYCILHTWLTVSL
jgi:hypothetical protein